MKANLLPLLALALLLAQCKKREPDPTPPIPTDPVAALPAETQTGAGTFGCLVNGKPFKGPFSTSARGDWQSATRLAIGSSTRLSGEPTAQQITLNIILNGNLQNGQLFTLISAASPFPIFTPGNNQAIGNAASTNSSLCYYSGDNLKTGKVELVKFDGPNRIASGRFAFTLYEPGGCDTLKVTNGRFDVKF
jgi:hypothetical protein